VPMRALTLSRTAAALAASPRARSSITRSTRLAAKVTPAALTTCRSFGASRWRCSESGPDAEIFTKAAPLSSVGTGVDVGLHPASTWNNPEPEVVLAVSPRGQIVGAALGNDVNLRDFEGRSALLLGKAKDNNASCGIGPWIRLCDAHFGIGEIARTEIDLTIEGEDGFVLHGASAMTQISRSPQELVAHAMGAHHQYPDGMMLFCGTLFAPVQDRDAPGAGFTHHLGDRVSISAPRLGGLVNWVGTSDALPPWTFGIGALMASLARRGLLDPPP